MAAPLFERLTIIGCGLIGSSIARAARRHDIAGEITVTDLSKQVRERATVLKLADRVTADIAEGVDGADLVIFAVPVLTMGAVMTAAAVNLRPGAIVTDVG